jgi:hypothetical protein
VPSATRAETRLALIVTNASYPNEIGKLASLHKDGNLSAPALKAVGFANGNITVIGDADQQREVLLRLATRLHIFQILVDTNLGNMMFPVAQNKARK